MGFQQEETISRRNKPITVKGLFPAYRKETLQVNSCNAKAQRCLLLFSLFFLFSLIMAILIPCPSSFISSEESQLDYTSN